MYVRRRRSWVILIVPSNLSSDREETREIPHRRVSKAAGGKGRFARRLLAALSVLGVAAAGVAGAGAGVWPAVVLGAVSISGIAILSFGWLKRPKPRKDEWPWDYEDYGG